MEVAARSIAARQLALSATITEVLDALAEAAIRAVMLKGAAIASRLYEPSELRLAGDVDLLVQPSNAQAAARVLEGLGFRDTLRGARTRERAPHAVTFRRTGTRPACVDLHTALELCHDDPEALWTELSGATTFIHTGGRAVEVLADSAQAFLIAAHALQHGGANKPREDLRRALARYDRDTWEEAAEIARRLDRNDVLTAGLSLSDAGMRLADDLSLTLKNRSVEIRLRESAAPPVAIGLMHLAELESFRERSLLILGELFPSRAWMRYTFPFAARGRAALTIAYLGRPFKLAVKLPKAFRAWRRATRQG